MNWYGKVSENTAIWKSRSCGMTSLRYSKTVYRYVSVSIINKDTYKGEWKGAHQIASEREWVMREGKKPLSYLSL